MAKASNTTKIDLSAPIDTRRPAHFGELARPVPDAAAALGVSVTTTYELIRGGEIETILVGRRRLVLNASLLAYVERQRTAEYQPRAVPWDAPAPQQKATKPQKLGRITRPSSSIFGK